MKKYIQIVKGTIAEYVTYRLNFATWRARMVIQLLVTYFLWWAIFSTRRTFFDYSQSMILTYILLSSIVRVIAMGTTTQEIGYIITQGDLQNYLVRPIHFFRYYMARDIGDKLLNVVFSIVEVTMLFLILKPQIYIQTNPLYLGFTVISLVISMVLFFYFSLFFSLLGFWTPDIWAPRFLSMVLMEFFGGGLFPLDILPKGLFLLSQSLPFSYFMYFPLKVYLGQLPFSVIYSGYVISILWIVGLYTITLLSWKKGLRSFGAEGK